MGDTTHACQSSLIREGQKRSRSGCFTCRARRVKCDESHPVCQRCHNGGWTCDFPSPGNCLPRKNDIERIATTTMKRNYHRHSSVTARPTEIMHKTSMQRGPSLVNDQDGKHDKYPLASSKSRSNSMPRREKGLHTSGALATQLHFQRYSEQVRFHLAYLRNSLSCRHFFLGDSSNFIKHDLIAMAMYYEPLTYALVSFSAYHSALSCSSGDETSYSLYYGQALYLLRQSIRTESYNIATLCTTLVLATLEVSIRPFFFISIDLRPPC
ncbi:hypothetical protein N7456_007010 [Penicillium angulare]|uniref:Zn(2)-C6 fungal-type domain-containing protein n=1 Tax=Penicillium angulare TaxID=116970 RepID=A0A9W9FIQ6_9EURO|nr:hypothetical protein N7456_007010 [Penicillium angulare]